MNGNHINAPSWAYDEHIGEDSCFEQCETCYKAFHIDELSNAVVDKDGKPVEKLVCGECKEYYKPNN